MEYDMRTKRIASRWPCVCAGANADANEVRERDGANDVGGSDDENEKDPSGSEQMSK